jgi:hypothetical protein
MCDGFQCVVLRGLVVGALVVVISAVPAAAQDAGELDEAMVQMMAAWERYAEVGAPHQALRDREGRWNATVKFWYAPDAPPEVSKATSTVEPIMGGRYILERFSSTMPDGAAFEGMGLVGYDNLKDAFVAMWIDTMSSGILTAESTSYADDFSRIEFRGEAPDPVAGRYKVQRSVEHWTDADTRVMEAWETGPDGSEVKVMEITYRRK